MALSNWWNEIMLICEKTLFKNLTFEEMKYKFLKPPGQNEVCGAAFYIKWYTENVSLSKNVQYF